MKDNDTGMKTFRNPVVWSIRSWTVCPEAVFLLVAVIVMLSSPGIADGTFRRTGWRDAADKLLFGGMSERKVIHSSVLEITLAKDLKLEMVKVEKGTFRMGSVKSQGMYDGHDVTLSHDFWIGRYEITQKQFKAVTGDDSKWLKEEEEDLPQANVAWKTADEFCTKLNYLCKGKLPKGYYFSLPTEAQWEYAARGGKRSKNFQYSGGNDLDKVGWHKITSQDKPHKIGLKEPNELGIHDMSGNLREWCLDRYAEFEPGKPATDPQGPNRFKGKERVTRGGDYTALAEVCGVTYRNHDDPSRPNGYIGFRVVLVFDVNYTQWEDRGKKLSDRINSWSEKP